MKTRTEICNFLDTESGRLLLTGLALFACIVLSPFLGSLAFSLNVPYVIIIIFVIFGMEILPLIIIGYCFRGVSPGKSILVVFLATGVFRVIANVFLSPVPITLITTSDYLVQVGANTAGLCIIAAGVSLFNNRKILSSGIIVAGIIFYILWKILNMN
jgi:hypothetical protein